MGVNQTGREGRRDTGASNVVRRISTRICLPPPPDPKTRCVAIATLQRRGVPHLQVADEEPVRGCGDMPVVAEDEHELVELEDVVVSLHREQGVRPPVIAPNLQALPLLRELHPDPIVDVEVSVPSRPDRVVDEVGASADSLVISPKNEQEASEGHDAQTVAHFVTAGAGATEVLLTGGAELNGDFFVENEDEHENS